MDIKIALGKIEQYWQIIRNLHFHIEQEGTISKEEYALIEKYLKIISQKYQELIVEDVNGEIENITSTDSVNQNFESEKTEILIQEEKVVEKVIAPDIEATPIVENNSNKEAVQVEAEPVSNEPIIEEEEVILPVEEEPIVIFQEELVEERAKPIVETLSKEFVSETPKVQSISSLLEQMLEGPDTVPEAPHIVKNNQDANKAPSLNDKLKEMKTPLEDLNSKIKKTTAEKISLNDKFEYIRELFGNNPVEYAAVIQQFDNYGINIWDNIEAEFSARYNWASKPGTVEKLKSIILNK
ncbi:MAG: hypothetical protein M9958_11325 [Chitinophagales bacterium]|nr:hypothetical protein [Chitinophagales bacterium]